MSGQVPTNGRKSIRLPHAAYSVAGSSWHMVLAVKPAAGKPFADVVFGTAAMKTIADRSKVIGIDLLLACLMPDHVHLLISPGPANVLDAVADIKAQVVRTSWAFGFQGSFWQRRFYDHGIRGATDLQATVNYILENPVKAELAEDWNDYPLLTGSLLRD